MLDDLRQMFAYIDQHRDDFLELLIQHIQLALLSVVIGILIAVPLAVLASRFGLVAKPMTWLAAIGQTIPTWRSSG